MNWGAQTEDSEEIEAAKLAEYKKAYFKQVTNDHVKDAITELYNDEDACDDLAIYLRSGNYEKIGKRLTLYFKEALNDEANHFAQEQLGRENVYR